MPTWRKLTGLEHREIYVNLDNVLSLAWHEHGHGTIITYAGVEKDHIVVKQTPDEIIQLEAAR